MTADIAMDSQRANVGGGEQFPVGRALNEFSLLKAGKENQRFAQDVQEPQQFRSQNVPFLEFGDFGIAELFLLNLNWLLKQRHHLEVLA